MTICPNVDVGGTHVRAPLKIAPTLALLYDLGDGPAQHRGCSHDLTDLFDRQQDVVGGIFLVHSSSPVGELSKK